MKPVQFQPEAVRFIKAQSVELKKQIGEVLRDVQKGMLPGMPINKPMPSVAPGVYEIRVSDRSKTVRVFYVTKIRDFIWVFHAFEKRTQKTPRREIELGRKRIGESFHG
jgi:phage-related protein